MLPIAKQINLPERVGLRGRLDRRIGDDQQRDRSPFRRSAQLGEMRKRCRLRKRLAPRGHLVVPRGRAILAPLGDRLQRVGLLRNLGDHAQQ